MKRKDFTSKEKESKKQKIISQIHQDILRQIFLFLPSQDKKNFLSVNKEWRNLAKTIFLSEAWKLYEQLVDPDKKMKFSDIVQQLINLTNQFNTVLKLDFQKIADCILDLRKSLADTSDEETSDEAVSEEPFYYLSKLLQMQCLQQTIENFSTPTIINMEAFWTTLYRKTNMLSLFPPLGAESVFKDTQTTTYFLFYATLLGLPEAVSALLQLTKQESPNIRNFCNDFEGGPHFNPLGALLLWLIRLNDLSTFEIEAGIEGQIEALKNYETQTKKFCTYTNILATFIEQHVKQDITAKQAFDFIKIADVLLKSGSHPFFYLSRISLILEKLDKISKQDNRYLCLVIILCKIFSYIYNECDILHIPSELLTIDTEGCLHKYKISDNLLGLIREGEKNAFFNLSPKEFNLRDEAETLKKFIIELMKKEKPDNNNKLTEEQVQNIIEKPFSSLLTEKLKEEQKSKENKFFL